MEGKPPAPHCLLELLSQFRGLRGPDDGPEVQLREGIIRTLDSQRVAEAQAFDDRQVSIEERGQQASLDDIPRVRSAPLLGVFEPLAQMLGEQLPLGEVPYPPRVQPFLLKKVAAAAVGQGSGGGPSVGSASNERECPYPGIADQHVAQLAADPAEQCDRKTGAGHEGVGERQAVEAALARRLCHHGIAGQHLNQLGVHLDAHRVVPARNVRHGPGRGRRSASVPIASWRSISSTYQRTPSRQRSTSATASRHGLPISQTNKRASRSRWRTIVSIAAVTRSRRSAKPTFDHAAC